MKNISEEYLYGHFRSQAELQAGVILSQIFSPVLMCVGTVGNMLSVMVFRRITMRKSVISRYLLGLAVADLIVLYVCLLREWIRYSSDYDIRIAANWTCKLHWWLYYVTLHYSVWLLTTVSAMRFMSTFKPSSNQTRFLKLRADFVIVSICLASLIINSHFLFGIELHQAMTMTENEDYTCEPGTEGYDHFISYVWHYVNLCTFSLIPFVIISFSNICIMYKVVSRNKMRIQQLGLFGKEKISSMTKVLLALNIVFIICSAPICIYLIILKYWVPPDIPKTIQEKDPWYMFVSLLMYIKNTVNFILYSLSWSRFRQELRDMFKKRSPSNN